MPSTEIGSGKYGEVLLAVLDRGSQIPTPVAVKELQNVGTRDVRGRVALVCTFAFLYPILMLKNL